MAAKGNVSQTTHSTKPGDQTSTPIHSDICPTSPEEAKQGGKQTGNRYFGALVLVAAISPFPFFAALFTIIAYLSPAPPPAGAFFDSLGPGNMVIILGLIITLVLWLLLAIPCMRFATAGSGRPSDYESLQREIAVLRKEVDAIECEKTSAIAIADIRGNLEDIDKILNCDGLTSLNTGYVSLWDRINEADEAIIDVLPCEKVIESAKYEQLRLKNSLVPDSEDHLKLLDEAITTLSSDSNRSRQSAEQNLDPNLQHSLAQAMLALFEDGIDSSTRSASTEGPLYKRICRSIGRIFQPGSHQQDKANKLQQYMAQAMLALFKKATDPPSPSTAISEQEARANIRKVKAALHSFTNERWGGLLRARNQLIVTAFLAALFT